MLLNHSFLAYCHSNLLRMTSGCEGCINTSSHKLHIVIEGIFSHEIEFASIFNMALEFGRFVY